jgi:PAS domain S-box-containing protein
MPLRKARSVSLALTIALAVLLLPIALTVRDLALGGGAVAGVRFAALVAAFTGVGYALRRQRIISRQLQERERLDAERRAADTMLAGILAIAADAIITVDEHHRIIHFNKGAEEIFGWPAAEALGKPLSTLLPERFHRTHDAFVDEFARSADTARRMGHRREVAGRRQDGSEFPAEASISKLELPTGQRVFTAVVRDITERRWLQESEQFLAEAGSRLARTLDFDDVLQTVADCAAPLLADAALVDIADGASFRRISSASHGQHSASAVRDLAARSHLTWDSPSPVVDVVRRGKPELVPAVDEAWLEAHEEDPAAIGLWRRAGVRSMLIVPLVVGERTLGAISLLALDGRRPFSADVRALAEKYAAQASLALENARLYRDAQRASEARDQVLGVVSHDLRNPISAIAMCASALAESASDDATERESLLTTIVQSTDWMNRLIQDLLDVASIEAGRLALERERERIPVILDGALRMFEVEASQRHVRLATESAADLPLVNVDASRIIQVLGNLVRNALKFTPDGGRITVRASNGGREAVFAVSDTGPGIPLTDQPYVFDRYWHARRTANKRGTGLGLSIARGIVQAHGGRMWLESEPGRGTTFYFSIPT